MAERYGPDVARSVYSSFDVIGDIAIIKIPEEAREFEREIGEAIMAINRHVKAVFAQETPVSGTFRLRGLRYVAGEDRTVTVHKEHGCLFKVDVARVYFSPRLSYERARVASLVKPGEFVLNMFAGVGTFSIIIAKRQPTARVVSIDVNPAAVELHLENNALNKVTNVEVVLGDAAQVIREKFVRVADRVLMPLPERAIEFLDAALLALKPEGGWLHVYLHVPYEVKESEAISKAEELVVSELNKKGAEVLSTTGRRVREVATRLLQVCVDANAVPRSP